jgi:hypothetical protein
MGNVALKVTSSAVLGGTIDEIGGGKFANGAITGAYGMLFNELMHDDDDPRKKSGGNGTMNSRRVTVARGMSGDVVVALGPIGFAYETGFFVHNGKTYEFMSIGYALGLEASIGLNYFAIRDKQGAFTFLDYAGSSDTDNGSFFFYTYGRESSVVRSSDPYRTGYKVNSHGGGISVLPVGYSHIIGVTWVREYHEKIIYSPWQSTHGR